MIFTLEHQDARSMFIESIWCARSERSSPPSFISRAKTQWQIVVTKQPGHSMLTVRGPETRGSPSPIPENAEFIGITFSLGTYMPHWPTSQLVNVEEHVHAASTKPSFWLHDTTLPFPNFEDADPFVERLIRQGLLVRDPIVDAALQGASESAVSLRSVQRRFLHSTGLTHAAIRQIERAHQAAVLLEGGITIADVIFQTGYADQPHLTRHLKWLIGQTPAQLVRSDGLGTVLL